MKFRFVAICLLVVLFFLLNIIVGTIFIPLSEVIDVLFSSGENASQVSQNILLKSRLPQAATALAAGAGLSISGLQMQTIFHNPLASPSVLGISNGASLGVALVVLLSGSIGGVALSSMGLAGNALLIASAIMGSLAVMMLILAISQRVKGNATLLIIGVMVGYVATAIIGVLKYFSNEEDIRAYVVWGLGSFSRVSAGQVWLFVGIMSVLVPLSMLLIKTMNILLLGDKYAQNLGLDISQARMMVISCSGVMVAVVTAYCGPIMFLGLAVPHLCRALWRTNDNRVLMPATALTGSALALICNLIARMPGFEGALPVNSVTALIGAPIVASVLFRHKTDMM